MELKDRGLVPIRETFLKQNFRFALEFREGFVFGRVIKRRVMQYRPYSVIDSNGDTIDISANSSYNSQIKLRDPRNTSNELLYLQETTGGGFPWFMHGAFGVWPPQVRMYPRFPEGDGEVSGRFPGVDPIRPQQGNDLGYIDYRNSPYEVPTDHIPVVLPPQEILGAEFYNLDDDKTHNPVLNVLFALYFCQIFKPRKHADIISDIANGYKGANFLCVGYGDHSENMTDTLIKDWGIEPMPLDEASELGTVRGRVHEAKKGIADRRPF